MNELKRMNYLFSEMNYVFHQLSLSQGLSDSACAILYTLWDSDGCCPLKMILEYTGIPKQTVNSALRKLEQEGIVYLEKSEGRKKTVCLTQAGITLAKSTVGRIMEVENAILDSWSGKERELYLSLTQRYLDQFREKAKELCK